MKKSIKLMLIAIAVSFGMMSCSTNSVEDEPYPVNPEPETKNLNIRVVSNDFTRSEGDVADNAIQTLYLAFYKGEDTTPMYIKEATMGSNNTYSVEIPANMAKMLDKVIAFANITDKDIISGALTGSTIEYFQNGGYLIMSSAVYFENINSDSNPIYYSSITGSETTDSEPIPIYLERVAAKITVKKDNLGVLVPDIENSPKLSMDIIGWGITFTDNKSYLMKQLPDGYSTTFNALQSELSQKYVYSPAKWNKPQTISWANSFNYDKFSDTNIDKIKFSQAKNLPGTYIYAHETIRSASDIGKKNSKPSIVIVGQYKKGEENIGTFYRLRTNGKEYIYTTEDYFSYLYENQDFLNIKENGNITKASVDNLQNLLTLSNPSIEVAGIKIPEFYVSPQVKDNQDIEFCNKSGIVYSVADLNKLLYAHAGLLEMYFNGQCIFIEPIKHYQNSPNDIYGIIRNHSYTLNIFTIKGFGRGIASDDSVISEEELLEMSSTYKINTSTIINEWNQQDKQEITIDNTKL